MNIRYKLNNVFRTALQRFKNNTKNIALEGIGMTFILGFIFIILLSNVLRVVSNGRFNYQTYLYEKDNLQKVVSKNEELEELLNYSNSDEYKQLAARQTLALGEPAERFFRTKRDAEIIDTEKVIVMDVKEKKDFSDWWKLLLEF